jgi:hypothetical protein
VATGAPLLLPRCSRYQVRVVGLAGSNKVGSLILAESELVGGDGAAEQLVDQPEARTGGERDLASLVGPKTTNLF